MIERLQARWVDRIKRHALARTTHSPSAEAFMLGEYLWGEECAEGQQLAETIAASGPPWLGKMLARQIADEARHARLLRARLRELAREPGDGVARTGLMPRAKLAMLRRVCARATPRFAAGAVVPLLACAATLETTGVRIFTRHLAVLDERAPDGATADVLREILADEHRHARSCNAALDRLVLPHERDALADLRSDIARVDRALGVTSAMAMWLVLSAHAARDRARRLAARGAA